MKNKQIILSVFIAASLLSGCSLFKKKSEEVIAIPTLKPEPVNLIATNDRPFITLQPLPGRNELDLTIHDLKLDASEVEVILEYDRNEGVMDAVYRTFIIDKVPYSQDLFMGSKSAGGHITYHDDVVGGTLELRFSGGEEDYAIRVPWRYDDNNSPFDQMSTADTAFQISLGSPIKDSKIIVMESSGLPESIDEDIIAGPYLVRSVNDLPATTATLSIRLKKVESNPVLYGWDGNKYVEIKHSLNGKIITANTSLYSLYVVTN